MLSRQVGLFPQSNTAGPLYGRAKDFYSAFRMIFGNGTEAILGHDIPKLGVLGASLINYQYSVECMLKALIALKGKEPQRTHDLNKLLKTALLQKIWKSGMRYAEGTVSLRQPLQELSETMEYVFTTLQHTFESAR